jgi:succinate dehydrogenase flavin-adding protein (antitoxin of CptAB toxin-antitoxin module)
MPDVCDDLRRIRYRLNRQGMLELDVWLAPLTRVLEQRPELAPEVERLLSREAPELISMMQGAKPVPDELKEWLVITR